MLKADQQQQQMLSLMAQFLCGGNGMHSQEPAPNNAAATFNTSAMAQMAQMMLTAQMATAQMAAANASNGFGWCWAGPALMKIRLLCILWIIKYSKCAQK
jgi:hypothetical protein